MKTVSVVGMGMGPADISPAVRRAVEEARVLAGHQRLLALFPEHAGGRLPWRGGLSAWLEEVAQAAETSQVAVLASGDPGFFGVAASLLKRLGAERLRLVPNVTALQAAFAQFKLPWQEAQTVSLHGRDAAPLFSALVRGDLVAIYTDPVHHPGHIAGLLLERGQEGWRMLVAENLGADDQRLGSYGLREAAAAGFAPLNLAILQRTAEPEPLFLGMPEEAFLHQRGLITKTEVRAVALAKLRLMPWHRLWDLGAGCGSLGLEASRLLYRGGVVAVEREPARVEQIKANRARFGAANLEVIQGELPGALEGLAAPQRVFVGGGGPALAETLRLASRTLPPGGVLVAAAARLAALQEARQTLDNEGLAVDVTQVQASRGRPLADDIHFKALNPVWLVRGIKDEA
ncbi:hypothetical protein AAU61_03490 [Desulfocarbo indianensis]|nr:hypothetical protein AAU61_03490 [Desulfocarbo indianensis]